MQRNLRSNTKIDPPKSQPDEPLDHNLKLALSKQILHLGGLESCDWSILTATFDVYYHTIERPTRTQLYNKFKYWQAHPNRFDQFLRIATSPAIKSTGLSTFPSSPPCQPAPAPQSIASPAMMSSRGKNSSDYSRYLPHGYDPNRIGRQLLYTCVVP